MSEWEIEERYTRGPVDVRLDRRAAFYDLDDLEEALRTIAKDSRFRPTDEISFIDVSGYKTDIDTRVLGF